jgi:hypothetical protein
MCDNCVGFLSGATIVHKHACAGIGKRQGGCSPNTARRACDKSSFALDGIHRCHGS